MRLTVAFRVAAAGALAPAGAPAGARTAAFFTHAADDCPDSSESKDADKDDIAGVHRSRAGNGFISLRRLRGASAAAGTE